MIIGGVRYKVKGTWGPLEIPDSFVVRENKIGAGAGEAKYYVGPRKDPDLRQHFGNKFFTANCVMLKDEILRFLDGIREEYENPTQKYVHATGLPALWLSRRSKVASLPDVVSFDVSEQQAGGAWRCYVKGTGAYGLLRELPLPHRASVTFTSLESGDGTRIQLVRLHAVQGSEIEIDREGREMGIVLELLADASLDSLTRDQLIKARVGQGRFRTDLFVECGAVCPMTGIDARELLVASHIKPWRIADNSERLDPQNGLVLSPLWDKLFDQGFITFDDSGHVIVSGELDARTIRIIGLVDGAFYGKLPITGARNQARREYMAYHRDKVFLGR
jgi:hypothetical protein